MQIEINKKEKRPALKEPPKKLLIITQQRNSPKTRPLVDLFMSLKKDTKRYIDLNGECLPETSNMSVSNGRLEEQMKRLNATLFIYIHALKNNRIVIITGRTYEYQIIDMAKYEVITHEKEIGKISIPAGSIGIILLCGRAENPRLQNLILDLFRDIPPLSLSLSVCAHALGISFKDNSFSFDLLSLSHAPFSISPIINSIQFVFSNSYHVSETLFHKTKKIVRQTEKKIKNVEKGPLKSTIGVLHMEKQDLSEVQLSRGKAFRKRR